MASCSLEKPEGHGDKAVTNNSNATCGWMVANEDDDANLRHSENDLWVVGGIHCLELS